jgi:hypothetical protein
MADHAKENGFGFHFGQFEGEALMMCRYSGSVMDKKNCLA